MKEELDQIKTNLFIEQKTANLDERSKNYMKKVLSEKTLEYVTENFDYTLKLFKKKESGRLETLKEEALSNRDNVDRVIYEHTNDGAKVVNEKVESPYLSELSKY